MALGVDAQGVRGGAWCRGGGNRGRGQETRGRLAAPDNGEPASQAVLVSMPFLHRDVRALGITLMGHQKKILGSIQTMRAQLTSTQGPRRHL